MVRNPADSALNTFFIFPKTKFTESCPLLSFNSHFFETKIKSLFQILHNWKIIRRAYTWKDNPDDWNAIREINFL